MELAEQTLPSVQAGGRRAIVAAAIGNAFEWYDFSVYALFAIYMARIFFPGGGPTTELVKAFLAFGLGFVVRPLGAVVLGLYGDRAGRKAVLTATIALMTLGTAIIAFAPGYAAIGVGAPILLLTARMLQGFSAGGEIGGATALLMEHAPARRRGEYASWVQATMGCSNIMSALMAFGVTSLLTTEQLERFGWRLPFLFGLMIGPIGLWVRRTLEESPEFEREMARSVEIPIRPLRTLLADYPLLLLKGSALSILWTVSVYALVIYLPTYVQRVDGYRPAEAFAASLVGNGAMVAACVLAGVASDRLSRRAVLGAAGLWLALLSVPLLWLVEAHHSPTSLIAAQTLLCIGVGCFTGVAPSALAEMFPARVRSTGTSICYNLAVTLFSGFAPAILTWLSARGVAYVPGWYVIIAAVLAAPAVLGLKPAAPDVPLLSGPAEPKVSGPGRRGRPTRWA